MLDNGGDSVVLVSTIPSSFIVADELVNQSPSSAPARAAVPWCSGPGQHAVVPVAALNSDESSTLPGRRSSDDCSEITSTVADEPTAATQLSSPSAASASPSPDFAKQSVTEKVCDVAETKLTNATQKPSAAASSPITSMAVTTSTSVTTTTTTTSQQAGRQKKSLEMVVNLLKRPSTSSLTASVCPAAQPAAPSPPLVNTRQTSVTSSSVEPAIGHVSLNGGTCHTSSDDSIGLSLLQRLIATPSSAYRQPPVPTSSHFRFRCVDRNSSVPTRTQTGPPISQLKHMCKNVRSFVPSAQRRATQWRHPALDLLFGTPPVPVARPPRAAMHFAPRTGIYRGACVRGQDFARPRFNVPAAHLATSGAGVSRDRKQRDDGELSALMRVLLEASGNSRHTSTSSSSSCASSADLWKAAIN